MPCFEPGGRQCGAAISSMLLRERQPLAGVLRAQQPEQIRRIGVLMNIAENDPEAAVQVAALVRALKERGWIVGTNIQIDYRWAAGDSKLYRKYAPELIALAPDIILVVSGTGTGELQRATSTITFVFVGTTDPVKGGLIALATW